MLPSGAFFMERSCHVVRKTKQLCGRAPMERSQMPHQQPLLSSGNSEHRLAAVWVWLFQTFQSSPSPANTKRSGTIPLAHRMRTSKLLLIFKVLDFDTVCYAVTDNRTLLFLHARLFSESLCWECLSFPLIRLSLWIHVAEASGLIKDALLHGKQTSHHIHLSVGGSSKT